MRLDNLLRTINALPYNTGYFLDSSKERSTPEAMRQMLKRASKEIGLPIRTRITDCGVWFAVIDVDSADFLDNPDPTERLTASRLTDLIRWCEPNKAMQILYSVNKTNYKSLRQKLSIAASELGKTIYSGDDDDVAAYFIVADILDVMTIDTWEV